MKKILVLMCCCAAVGSIEAAKKQNNYSVHSHSDYAKDHKKCPYTFMSTAPRPNPGECLYQMMRPYQFVETAYSQAYLQMGYVLKTTLAEVATNPHFNAVDFYQLVTVVHPDGYLQNLQLHFRKDNVFEKHDATHGPITVVYDGVKIIRNDSRNLYKGAYKLVVQHVSQNFLQKIPSYYVVSIEDNTSKSPDQLTDVVAYYEESSLGPPMMAAYGKQSSHFTFYFDPDMVQQS